jgi:hypothetical protein
LACSTILWIFLSLPSFNISSMTQNVHISGSFILHSFFQNKNKVLLKLLRSIQLSLCLNVYSYNFLAFLAFWVVFYELNEYSTKNFEYTEQNKL